MPTRSDTPDASVTLQDDASARIRTRRWITLVALVLMALGAAQRTRGYLVEKSFWWDEAMLADNIQSKSATELLGPLDHRQTVPALFILACKASMSALGGDEWTGRLVPFVASLVGLPLFWLLARRVLPGGLALCAMGLWALSSSMVGYASEFKQYASDATLAALMLWLGVRTWQMGLSRTRLAVLSFVGAVAIWASHPALFFLPCIGGVLLWKAWKQPRPRPLLGVVIMGMIWIASFGAEYFLQLRHITSGDGWLEQYWSFAFAPLRPDAWWGGHAYHSYRWFRVCLLHMFEWPGGMTVAMLGLAGVTSVVGVMGLWREKRQLLLLLAGPVVLAILASAAHRYPFHRRMLLFAMPCVYLLLLEGVGVLSRLTLDGKRIKGLGMFVAALLLIGPAELSVRSLLSSPRQNLMPTLNLLQGDVRSDDAIYAHWGVHFELSYYQTHSDKIPKAITIVEGYRPTDCDERSEKFIPDIEQLRGRPRVWVVASHAGDRDYLRDLCAKLGTIIEEYPTPDGQMLLLVDFSTAENETPEVQPDAEENETPEAGESAP
jgi:hypothetical protein